MELLPGEEVIWRGHPSWCSRIGRYIRWVTAALVLAAIAGASDQETGLPYWQWILVSLVLVAAVVLVDLIRRLATTYTVTTRRLHIRHGILRRIDRSTHIDRVQNLNTRQSLLERVLAVGTVDFDTAGTDAAEASFTFEGVPRPHHLIRRVEELRAGAGSATAHLEGGRAGL